MASKTMQDILRAKKPRSQEFPMVVDSDRAAEIEQTSTALARTVGLLESLGPDPDDTQKADALSKRVDELRAKMDGYLEDGAIVIFRFQAIGRAAYKELLDENPALEPGEPWGPEFAPKLIAASSVEPEISEDEALELWDSESWSDAEQSKMLNAALVCNRAAPEIPLGKGLSATRN